MRKRYLDNRLTRKTVAGIHIINPIEEIHAMGGEFEKKTPVERVDRSSP